MNIVAYCRVSTNKDDQLNSLETQKTFFEEYAKKNGYNLIRIYADEGISGTKIKNRKQFLEMTHDSDKGLFNMVVVKDISRYARNAVDFLQSIRDLKAKGISCQFINANLSSHDSEMILGTLALVAQEESGNTSKRVKMSKKITGEKGRVPNIVYGYDKTKGDYYDLKINPAEADIIRRIFKMYLKDGHGASKIALLLNREGIKTKRDCNWSQNAVCRILTNRIYIGKIINGKEEVADFLTGVRTAKEEREWLVVEKPHLRIIDNNSFYKAGTIMSERSVAFNHNKTRQSNKHLFSTLLKCAECGYSYRRRVRTYKNTFTDWICSTRYSKTTDGGKCTNSTTVDEGELTTELEKYFSRLLKNKTKVANKVITKFNQIYKTGNANAIQEKELQDKLKNITRKREKCKDMYTDGQIDREEMNKDMANYNSQIEEINSKLSLVRHNINKGKSLDLIIADTFKNIRSVVSFKSVTNTQLKRIIDKIVVNPNGNVDVHLKLLLETGLEKVL
ncbi:MAG: recombinase family protein [Oscillospiraceae bacterium]|jgi:DNA invertase Pin-like site-specific DNA recombinase|nr:recombinase family protein [Oscillospiraceae bacterium]